MAREFIIEPSGWATKKFAVYEALPGGKKSRVVNFGGAGYADYTTHKDPKRKTRYIDRHRSGEDWSKNGILTAGFWSRWLLWNLPSMRGSLKDIESRFGVKVTKRR